MHDSYVCIHVVCLPYRQILIILTNNISPYLHCVILFIIAAGVYAACVYYCKHTALFSGTECWVLYRTIYLGMSTFLELMCSSPVFPVFSSLFFCNLILGLEVCARTLCHSHSTKTNRGLSYSQCRVANVAPQHWLPT